MKKARRLAHRMPRPSNKLKIPKNYDWSSMDDYIIKFDALNGLLPCNYRYTASIAGLDRPTLGGI